MDENKVNRKEIVYYLDAIIAIVWRGIIRWMKFKASFYTYLVSSFADAAIFGFMGAIVSKDSPKLSAWGGDYISFALLGLAFEHLLLISVSTIYQSFAAMFFSGSLEHFLTSPLPIQLALFGEVVASFARETFVFFTYFLAAIVFGARFSISAYGILAALAFTVAGIIGMMGTGLISGAMFSLINAKGKSEPFQWFVFTANKLLAGVTFPVALLPNSLQAISMFFPQVYVLDAVRRFLLTGSTGEPTLLLHNCLPFWTPLTIDGAATLFLASFWLVIGLRVFRHGIMKAQIDGNLTRWS